MKIIWYKTSLGWVDAEDLTEFDLGMACLIDTLVSRPTEFKAFLHLFAWAYNRPLTEKQEQALMLERWAVENGLAPGPVITEQMHMDRPSSSRILHRAKQRKMTTNDIFAATPSVDQLPKPDYWAPSKNEVNRIIRSIKVPCAAHGTEGCKGTASGNWGICPSCMGHYGIEGERDPDVERWLNPLILANRRMARDEAIRRLYENHYGIIRSPDEYEDAIYGAAD